MNDACATVRCVGGILHNTASMILLIKRGHAPDAGRWSLPGGRVEPEETDTAALVRELHEETGLTVTVREYAGSVTRGTYEIHDYHCTATAGTLRARDDAAAAQWVSAARLHELDEADALTEGLTEALRSWDALPR